MLPPPPSQDHHNCGAAAGNRNWSWIIAHENDVSLYSFDILMQLLSGCNYLFNIISFYYHHNAVFRIASKGQFTTHTDILKADIKLRFVNSNMKLNPGRIWEKPAASREFGVSVSSLPLNRVPRSSPSDGGQRNRWRGERIGYTESQRYSGAASVINYKLYWDAFYRAAGSFKHLEISRLLASGLSVRLQLLVKKIFVFS